MDKKIEPGIGNSNNVIFHEPEIGNSDNIIFHEPEIGDGDNVIFHELGMGDNANVILHELGNIVMLMNLSINRIEKEYDNIEKNKYFRNLKEDTKQIVYLINSSKESGKIYSIEKKNTDIEKLVYGIVEKYEERCEKSSIKLSVIVENKSKNNFINMDSFKMSRVFENIIINSIEELEMCNIKEKKINIKLSVNEVMENKVTISINNNGRVINSDRIGEIFKPYITEKKNGNGIGLAYCEKIVKLHGGNIEVISNQKDGTTFIINI